MRHGHVAAIVLAAGAGTRFRSDRAKVLHEAAGRTLVAHVLEAVRGLDLGQVVVVVGHQADAVRAEVEASGLERLTTVVQHEQLGTGHAVQQALPALSAGVEQVLVLPGDTPLVTSAALGQLLGTGAPGSMLVTTLPDPSGYGRVIRGHDGAVTAIVEERDADPDQRSIHEVNAGMYLLAVDELREAVSGLRADNRQGELYLTDVVAACAARGRPVAAVEASPEVVAGVNDRSQLASAAAELRRRHLEHLMVEVGVTVVDPAATYVDVDVEVATDAVLLPGTLLERGTRVGSRAVVGPNSHLSACEVGDDAVVHSTRAVDAVVGAGASVGPFAHLRAGTRLASRTKVGAYVETKNAIIGTGSKVPHLAYLGDAVLGTDVNVACGVITVNYDGLTKSQTTIEDGAFIGCDTMLVAPVTIGAGAYTAAGSTITADVPAGALAIARARQVVKDGWAARRNGADDS